MKISDRLRQIEAESGMSSQQWADAAGIHVGTLNRILSGKTENPGIETLSMLAEAVGMTVTDILDTAKDVPQTGQCVNIAVLRSIYETELRKRDRWIRFLCCLSIILFVAMVMVGTADVVYRQAGWFR